MAKNFLDALRQEKDNIEDNEKEAIPTPKNDILRVNDKNKELLLRLLPSVSLLKESGDASLGVKQHSIMLNLTFTRDGKENKTFTSLNLPTSYDKTNETQQSVDRWIKEGKLRTKFGESKPRNVFWVNVLQLVNKNGKMTYVLDDDGNPKVFAFQATSTVYRMLLDKLTDPLLDLGDTLEDSLIGWNKSYPVKVSYVDQTTRTVDIYTNDRVALSPISKEVIIPQLDSFSELTKPSDETQPEWFATVKKNLDADSEQSGSSLGSSIDGANLEDPFSKSIEANDIPDPLGINNNDVPREEKADTSEDLPLDTENDSEEISEDKQKELDDLLAGL